MNILDVKDAAKAYSENNYIWKNLNFKLNSGEIVGLIGVNGSGKTTLFKSILGTISLTSGKINTDLNVEKDIGYLLEIELFNNLTAYENLKLLGLYSGFQHTPEKINESLKDFGLLKNSRKKVKSFSFGMKQRLRLAAATIVPRKLLLLDEPLVGLDPNGIKDFLETIKKISQRDNTTFVISTHQISELSSLFDRYYFFSNHRLHESTAESNYYEITCAVGDNVLDELSIQHTNNIIYAKDVKEAVAIITKLDQNKVNIQKIECKDQIQQEVFK